DKTLYVGIWSVNAKKALTVDWAAEKAYPTKVDADAAGEMLVPQVVDQDMFVGGGNGNLVVQLDDKIGERIPWKKDYVSYPLIVKKDEPVAFASCYEDSPRKLLSVLCVGLNPPELKGEIKMPESGTTTWCLYNKKEKVLIVAEHEWHWIAII